MVSCISSQSTASTNKPPDKGAALIWSFSIFSRDVVTNNFFRFCHQTPCLPTWELVFRSRDLPGHYDHNVRFVILPNAHYKHNIPHERSGVSPSYHVSALLPCFYSILGWLKFGLSPLHFYQQILKIVRKLCLEFQPFSRRRVNESQQLSVQGLTTEIRDGLT